LVTDTLSRCTKCQNCREFKFQADSISFKENPEFKVILNGLLLDVKKKK
jgi:hypothetical protein